MTSMTSFPSCEYIRTEAADEIHTYWEIKTDSKSENPETTLQNDEVPHRHDGPVVSVFQCAG